MKHQLYDEYIEEVFSVSTTSYDHVGSDVLCVNYLIPIQSTCYTKEDLLHMISILDDKEEGD